MITAGGNQTKHDKAVQRGGIFAMQRAQGGALGLCDEIETDKDVAQNTVSASQHLRRMRGIDGACRGPATGRDLPLRGGQDTSSVRACTFVGGGSGHIEDAPTSSVCLNRLRRSWLSCFSLAQWVQIIPKTLKAKHT